MKKAILLTGIALALFDLSANASAATLTCTYSDGLDDSKTVTESVDLSIHGQMVQDFRYDLKNGRRVDVLVLASDNRLLITYLPANDFDHNVTAGGPFDQVSLIVGGYVVDGSLSINCNVK